MLRRSQRRAVIPAPKRHQDSCMIARVGQMPERLKGTVC